MVFEMQSSIIYWIYRKVNFTFICNPASHYFEIFCWVYSIKGYQIIFQLVCFRYRSSLQLI